MQGRSGSLIGKLPYPQLEKVINSIRRVQWPSTIVGPGPGEDSGVVDLGSCYLVSHVDPITEAGSGIGRLAVIVSANDIAVTGARPRWAQILILLPKGYPQELLEEIVAEIGDASELLGIDIIGGHTEYSPGISKPIVALYVMGCACRDCLVPTGNARVGDLVIQIGSAAREGASILARDFKTLLLDKGVGADIIERAIQLGKSISVVDIAVELAERGLVNSMHDATEGGILGSLVELALASRKRVKIWSDRIIVDYAVREIAKALNIDPLKLISSGTLIATSPREKVETVMEEVGKLGFEAAIIGTIIEGEPSLIIEGRDGSVIELKEPPVDEISRFWV